MRPAAANPELSRRLAAFDRKWTRLAAQFRAVAPPPWWAPGLILDAAIRQNYERCLPAAEYLADLAWLLVPALPAPDWLPALLTPPPPPSLPDLWRQLPPPFAGRCTWREDELWPLACVLASPPRFGTRAGRHPEQLAFLRDRLAGPAVLLDLGCGSGQGTWELALQLDPTGGGQVLGLTREPLEVWMAAQRELPHLPEPGPWAFPPLPCRTRVEFLAADLRALPPLAWPPANVLVCNGLLGGPALHDPAVYPELWNGLCRLAAPGAWLLIGDHFHAGHSPAVAAFLAAAPPGVALIETRAHTRFLRLPGE